jgi:hypothetical protein
MKPKPLEVGDSVQAKYTVDVHGNKATTYIDGKLICRSDDPDDDYWLVEYQLECVYGSPKYQDWWCESAIASKHYIAPTEDALFEKAEKISIDDYDGILFWDDYYFDSVDELLEHWENIAGEDDEPPNKYAWACDTAPVKLQIDLEDYVSEHLEEHGYEGLSERLNFQLLFDELRVIQDKFVALAAQETVSYPNYKKAVLL